MSELMDLRELAAYLRLDRQTIHNWLHQRKLTGIKMGGVWRFNRQAIDRWLQERTISAAPDGSMTGRYTTSSRPAPPVARSSRTARSHTTAQRQTLAAPHHAAAAMTTARDVT